MLSESLNKMSGNCWFAGFCTKYPRASGSLKRPPNPLPYRTNPPLKISAYEPAIEYSSKSCDIFSWTNKYQRNNSSSLSSLLSLLLSASEQEEEELTRQRFIELHVCQFLLLQFMLLFYYLCSSNSFTYFYYCPEGKLLEEMQSLADGLFYYWNLIGPMTWNINDLMCKSRHKNLFNEDR